jgi:hypothetical protein
LSIAEHFVIIRTINNSRTHEMQAPKRKKSEHYVNNKQFLTSVIELREFFTEGKKLGHENHRVSVNYFRNHPDRKTAIKFKKCYEYLGDCFSKIGNHLAYKPNFVNYMYRDDMVCDGIENCIQYICNFDPEKSSNPFAYFTQIIHYAFLRRIQKEKKQMEIRSKIIERSGYDEVFTVDGDGIDAAEYNSIKDAIQTKMYQ